MDLLNAEGETIFLDVSVGELETIGRRYKTLIQNKEDVAVVAKHMFERRPYWGETPHCGTNGVED